MNAKNYLMNKMKNIWNHKLTVLIRYYVSIVIFVIFSAGMTGCKTTEYVEVPVERSPLNIKDLPVLKPRNIEWHIITPENQKEVFKELSKDKYDQVLFGLTDDGYENLSLNLAELRTYIIQQRLIIQSYKDYYEGKEGKENEEEKPN